MNVSRPGAPWIWWSWNWYLGQDLNVSRWSGRCFQRYLFRSWHERGWRQVTKSSLLNGATGPQSHNRTWIKTPLDLLKSLQLGASGIVADWQALGDLPHSRVGFKPWGKPRKVEDGWGRQRRWSPKKDQSKWGIRATPQQSSDMQVL